jgi:hypothetical protein
MLQAHLVPTLDQPFLPESMIPYGRMGLEPSVLMATEVTTLDSQQIEPGKTGLNTCLYAHRCIYQPVYT